jgi:GxxExxY protein
MEAGMLYEELSGTIIGAAMEVHNLLGCGFLESVYEHALASELTERQIPFERRVPILVLYKQAQVGECRADFLVDGQIMLEIKATETLQIYRLVKATSFDTHTGLDKQESTLAAKSQVLQKAQQSPLGTRLPVRRFTAQ